MRKGGGKAKGASFERGVCKALSLWVTHGQQEDVYWRSAMSGGRSTVAGRKGKRLAAQAGDISCIHSIGHKLTDAFLIELKFYKSLDYHGLVTGKGNLMGFWATAKREAAKYDKRAMMIAKQNQLPTIVCLTNRGIQLLGVNRESLLFTVPRVNMCAMLLDTFLEMAKPP